MSLASRLRGGEALFGVFSMLAEPALIEITGLAGFDYAIIDTEHGPAGHEALQNCLRAGDAVGLECLVRVPQGADHDIQRALDSGAAGIIAPHVRSAAEARDLVAACHYPPAGRRGTAFTARHGGYGLHAASLTKVRAADVLVVAQIEDVEAVQSIDEIAQVDGLDCLFVGPADLGVSMGLTGDEAHRAVREALHGPIASAASAAGKLLGCFVSGAEEAVDLVNRGCALVAVSGMTLIAARHRVVAEAYRAARTHSAHHASGGDQA